MIWIVDNGGQYSDHEIAFVDVPDGLPREKVIEAFTYASALMYEKPFIVGVADKVEWWEGGDVPFAEFAASRCGMLSRSNSDSDWEPSPYAKKAGCEFIRAAGIDVAASKIIDEYYGRDYRDAARVALRTFMEGKP